MIIINKIPARLQEEPQDFNLIFDPLLDVKKLGGTMEKSSIQYKSKSHEI